MAENVDRMVWMGAGRPPGPGSWEASDARETNSQPSPLSAKLPFCFLSNHHQQPATNIIQPRQAKVDNNWEYLRIPKQRVTSFIHCNGLVGRQGAGPCITPFEEISAFGFLVGKLPRNPGAAHAWQWLNSLRGMFTRSVPPPKSPGHRGESQG